jgi:uncharacterized membrane protein YjgN (DUF898 family)
LRQVCALIATQARFVPFGVALPIFPPLNCIYNFKEFFMTDVTGQSQTDVRYIGTKSEIFNLGLKNGLLTIVTLGIYRFWAKTRMRRHIWSSTQVRGEGFEYTGTGMEKFQGFLIAMVVLAVYLAVVNLILFALGLEFVSEPTSQAEIIAQIVLIYANFFALLPLIYFAQYRSMRYKLSRTRFRGIRFGMQSAAGGYVWRALLLTLVTAISLGTLWPLMSFRLDKYMTDRAYYGDGRFEQSGKWTALYRFMLPFGVGIVLFGLGSFVANATGGGGFSALLLIAGGLSFYFGLIYYQVRTSAYLTSNRVLDGKIGFNSTPSVGSIIGIIIGGGLVVGLAAAVYFGIFAGMVQGIAGPFPGPAMLVFLALAYLFGLVLLGAVGLAMVTQPLLAHVLGATRVLNIEATDDIRQRTADKGTDAEGFADALDVGSAF